MQYAFFYNKGYKIRNPIRILEIAQKVVYIG